jgi:hypothetical protein
VAYRRSISSWRRLSSSAAPCCANTSRRSLKV